MNAQPPGDGWQTIASAPKDGYPVPWVEGWNGEKVQRIHWAYGGGEDQPHFGPAWFYAVESEPHASYYEMHPQPTHWRPERASVLAVD